MHVSDATGTAGKRRSCTSSLRASNRMFLDASARAPAAACGGGAVGCAERGAEWRSLSAGRGQQRADRGKQDHGGAVAQNGQLGHHARSGK